MHMRLKIHAFWICLGLAAGGCAHGKGEITKVQAHYRAIFTAIEGIQASYNAKNQDSFERLLSLDSPEAASIRSAAEHDFAAFDSVSIRIWTDRIHLYGAEVEVSCHWSGDWRPPGGGRSIQREGNSTLFFSGKDTPLLAKIVGDIPFGISPVKESGQDRRFQ
jgi:hypothetical protein